MKRYRVDGGPATFGPGQVMTLTGKQIEPRQHNLDGVPKDYDGKKPLEVKALAVMQFKVGEVIGLPELPKYLAEVMIPLDRPEGPVEEIALEKKKTREADKATAKRDAGKAKK